MITISIIDSLLSRFRGAASPQSSNEDLALCFYGQPGHLSHVDTITDTRTNHALAVLELETSDHETGKQIYLNWDQLHMALHSYPESNGEKDPNAAALHLAATLVMARESELHQAVQHHISAQHYL